MILEIKKVDRCRNGAYGNFIILGHEKARITISMKKNDTLGEYAATLLHEMLHGFYTLLRVEGFKLTNKTEHKMIEETEDALFKIMRRYFKDGKPKNH